MLGFEKCGESQHLVHVKRSLTHYNRIVPDPLQFNTAKTRYNAMQSLKEAVVSYIYLLEEGVYHILLNYDECIVTKTKDENYTYKFKLEFYGGGNFTFSENEFNRMMGAPTIIVGPIDTTYDDRSYPKNYDEYKMLLLSMGVFDS